MRVRHLLFVGIALVATIVALRLAVLVKSTSEAQRIDELQLSVDRIARDAASLVVLAQDFLLHRSSRANRQWHAAQAELARTLPLVARQSTELKERVDSLREIADGLPGLFDALEAARPPIRGGADAAPADDSGRRELLADHLTAETLRISEGSFELARQLVEMRRARAQTDRNATVAGMIAFTTLALLIAAVVRRRMLKPSALIEAAARAMRSGDLDARSNYCAGDEFGHLSQAFDDMAQTLQQRSAALEATHDRFEIAADSADIGVWEWDSRAGTLIWDERMYRLYGRERSAELEPYSLWATSVHIGDRGRVEAHLQRALNGEVEYDPEFRIVRPDGELRHIKANARLIRDAHGEPLRMTGVNIDITAAKHAEQKLRSSEAFLDRTGRVAGVGGWEVDVVAGTVVWSDETRRIHDVAPDFVPTLAGAITFYREDARETIRNAVQRGINGGVPWDLELPLITARGRNIWVRAVGEAVIEGGIATRLFGAFQDITARKLLDERLADSERFLRQITDGLPVRIAYIDRQSRYRFVNQAQCNGFGLPRNSILGRTRGELLEQSEADVIDARIAAALGGKEQRFEYNERIGGDMRCIEKRLVPDIDGDGVVRGVFATSSDITERKQAELDLRETSSLLRTVLDSASEVSIIATDPEHKITVFNAGAERLLGYTSAEIVGKTTPTLIHDREEVEARARDLSAEVGHAVEGGQVLVEPSVLRQPREWIYVRKDGSRVSVSLVMTAMHAQDGTLFGYLGVAHDVTRQKEHEATLRVAMHKARQANMAKSQFLANMSHEIRTPMNAVIGLTYLLGHTKLDREQATFVDKIRISSKSLLGLINDVLDLSKVEAGELAIESAPFSLAMLLKDLDDITAMQAEAKGIHFEIDAAGDLPDSLRGDPTRLNQILINLLANAIKFTERGSVTLQVCAIAAEPERTTLRFAVKDTGIGIERTLQDKLFMPFIQADASMTRRFGGTGLGLSIVKRLVDLLGGRVSLASTPGVGSEFGVELTFEVIESTVPGLPPGPSPIDDRRGLQGVRVLVVDDSDINLDVAKRILQLEGAEVDLAENGQVACDRLRAAPEAFDIVLMDVQMPHLDGFEATRRIRGELGLKRLPVIALTAAALTSERDRAEAVGMNGFISKPFEPRALVRSILVHMRPTTLPRQEAARSDAQVPDEARPAWPSIDGIDTDDVRSRLGDDAALFCSMLTRLLNEFAGAPLADSVSTTSLSACAARLHKLRGSAGMLGAKTIQHIAADAEAVCRAGDAESLPPLLDVLADELRLLKVNAAPVLEAAARAEASAALPSSSKEPDPRTLTELITLLRRHDLSALDHFRDAAPSLRSRLGGPAFETIRRCVDDLQFDDAAAMLAGQGGRSGRDFDLTMRLID